MHGRRFHPRPAWLAGIALLILAPACGRGEHPDARPLGRRMEKLDPPDPVRRAVEDRMATIDAAIPLMRSVRRSDGGSEGTLELIAWLQDDSVALVHGTAHMSDGGGGDFRYYFDGSRLIGFRREDHYPKGTGALGGKRLESEATFAADGALLHWSQLADGLPVPLPAERRDWLVRQWVNEGAGWRNLMARMAADSPGRGSERGSTP